MPMQHQVDGHPKSIFQDLAFFKATFCFILCGHLKYNEFMNINLLSILCATYFVIYCIILHPACEKVKKKISIQVLQIYKTKLGYFTEPRLSLSVSLCPEKFMNTLHLL